MVIPHPGAIFLKEVLSVKKSGLKFFALVFSAVLALMCLSGCGSSSNTASNTKYTEPLYYAENDTYGYYIYEDHAELKKFFGTSTLEVTIPSEVPDSKSGKDLPLTVIGKGSFNADSGVQTLNIPDSVTEIRSGAFHDCLGLETVNFGKNVKKIGANAFAGCMGLININLSDSVESIGAYAFSGCSTLEKLELKNVKEIGDNAFEKCISMNTVSGGENLTLIGKDAFSGTPWFESQTDEFVTIGKSLVKYNGNAAEIELDGKIEGVSNAFAGKDNITKINMPSVKFICNNAFIGCTALSDVTLSDDAEFIGCGAFEGTAYMTNLTADKDGFVIVGKVLVKYIGDSTSVRIPKGIKMISDAFKGNETIVDIATGDSVKTIGLDAFYKCSNLKTVIIGKNVSSIDSSAFDDCTISEFNAGTNAYAAYWAVDAGLSNVIYG